MVTVGCAWTKHKVILLRVQCSVQQSETAKVQSFGVHFRAGAFLCFYLNKNNNNDDKKKRNLFFDFYRGIRQLYLHTT